MGSLLFVGRSRDVEEEMPRVFKRIHRVTGIPIGDLREMNFVFRQEHPTGRITIEEFIQENVNAHGGSDAFWERVYRFIDNENGKQTQSLTFEHVITAIMIRQAGEHQAIPTDKSLKQMFRFIDIAGDGLIDEDELTVVFTWCYELNESKALRVNPEVLQRFCAHIPQVMQAIASNQPIKLQKLKNLCPALLDPRLRAKQMLKMLDIDGDGVVTEFEFIEKCRSDQVFIEAFSFIPRST